MTAVRSSDATSSLVEPTLDRFLSACYGAGAWEALVADPRGWSREHWQRMAELGWLGVCLPDAVGGLGCALGERLAIMEAIGKGRVLEPYFGTAVVCAELLQALPAQGRAIELLSAIPSGDKVLALAAYEPGGGFDLSACTCQARRSDGGYRLSGRKAVVLDGPSADVLIVLARVGEASEGAGPFGLFAVAPEQAGVRLRAYPTVDRRRCADLAFEEVELTRDACLAEGDLAWAAVQRAMDHAALALSAEAVGAMQALLKLTIAHLKERQQFSRPLAEFQVLRHRVVDMYMACEQARALTWAAVPMMDADAAARQAACSAARAQASWAGRYVGSQAVQLHGGMGVTDELEVGHHFKRLLAQDGLIGTADHQVRRFMQAQDHPALTPGD